MGLSEFRAILAEPELQGRALFDRLAPAMAAPRLAHDFLDQGLATMRAAPDQPLPFAVHEDKALQSLVIVGDRRFSLSIAALDATRWKLAQRQLEGRARQIGYSDGWSRLRFLKGRGCGQIYRLEHRSGAPASHIDARLDLDPGKIIDLANARQSLTFADVGESLLMLRLLVRDPRCDVAHECDADSGRLVRSRQARDDLGRQQMLMAILRAMGRQDAIPIVDGQMQAWPPSLRWQGMREWLALDAQTGMARLRTMAQSDDDARLRDLAERTLHDLVSRHPQLAAAEG
ncbi:MAG: hypothetical protein R3E02_15665 [Blastomonas sp.]